VVVDEVREKVEDFEKPVVNIFLAMK